MSESVNKILKEASKLVVGDRGDDYGPPIIDFTRTAKMWTGILGAKLKEDITPQEIGLCMIALKMSREVHKHKLDNLVDIVGYAMTVQMVEDEL